MVALFKITHVDARMIRNGMRSGKPFFIRRALFLKRVLRGNQPPNGIKFQSLKREQRDIAMPIMRRVEGAAKQTNALVNPTALVYTDLP